MQKSRFMLIAGIAMVATLLPFLLSRQSPQAKAATRIRNQYLAVEAPLLRLPPDRDSGRSGQGDAPLAAEPTIARVS